MNHKMLAGLMAGMFAAIVICLVAAGAALPPDAPTNASANAFVQSPDTNKVTSAWRSTGSSSRRPWIW